MATNRTTAAEKTQKAIDDALNEYKKLVVDQINEYSRNGDLCSTERDRLRIELGLEDLMGNSYGVTMTFDEGACTLVGASGLSLWVVEEGLKKALEERLGEMSFSFNVRGQKVDAVLDFRGFNEDNNGEFGLNLEEA